MPATLSHELFLRDKYDQSLRFQASIRRAMKTERHVEQRGDKEIITESAHDHGYMLEVAEDLRALTKQDDPKALGPYHCIVQSTGFLTVATPDNGDLTHNWINDIHQYGTWPKVLAVPYARLNQLCKQAIFLPCTEDGVIKRLVLGDTDPLSPEIAKATYLASKPQIEAYTKQHMTSEHFDFDKIPEVVFAKEAKAANLEPIYLNVLHPNGGFGTHLFYANAKHMADKGVLELSRSFTANLSCHSGEVHLMAFDAVKATKPESVPA